MNPSTNVRLINNDTGAEYAQLFYNFFPQQVQPSKTGYTIVADARTAVARPAAKWKVRLFAENITPALVEREFMWSKAIVQDFEEPYIPNKNFILYRLQHCHL